MVNFVVMRTIYSATVVSRGRICHCMPLARYLLLMAALRSTFLLSLLLIFIIISEASSSSSDIQKNVNDDEQTTQIMKGPSRRLLPGLDCGGRCGVRCSAHSRPNVCIRACFTCCERCRCVPPGTAGNRELCGRCYTDMRTHGNRPKCP